MSLYLPSYNSSVYVRNGNQGEYTKNTHCEKKYI